MVKLRFPRVVWKQTIYATSDKRKCGFFEKISRMRLRKKGIKNAYCGLESIYGMYAWDEEDAVIYLSAKKLELAILKIETLLHEFLHHLNTTFLSAPIE